VKQCTDIFKATFAVCLIFQLNSIVTSQYYSVDPPPQKRETSRLLLCLFYQAIFLEVRSTLIREIVIAKFLSARVCGNGSVDRFACGNRTSDGHFQISNRFFSMYSTSESKYIIVVL
jgi:hypothetical protein